MRTTRAGRLCATVATAALIATGVPAASSATAAPTQADDSFRVTTSSGCVVTVKQANVKTAFTHFVKNGYTKKQSAGIVGNLIVESGLNSRQQQCGGPGMGIAQWEKGGRWDTDTRNNMKWYAGQINQPALNLTPQLRFISYELWKFPQYGKSSLKKQTTVKGAMNVFLSKFEGASVTHTDRRYWHARNVYGKFT